MIFSYYVPFKSDAIQMHLKCMLLLRNNYVPHVRLSDANKRSLLTYVLISCRYFEVLNPGESSFRFEQGPSADACCSYFIATTPRKCHQIQSEKYLGLWNTSEVTAPNLYTFLAFWQSLINIPLWWVGIFVCIHTTEWSGLQSVDRWVSCLLSSYLAQQHKPWK